MVDQQQIVNMIVEQIRNDKAVEGAYLSGSLVTSDKDQFSDIDLGIVSKNNEKALNDLWSLREKLTHSVGKPITFLERGWEHCKMVAALYSKFAFPPFGFEVDVIFSQLKYVSEQMPYSDYEVVFDRFGRLGRRLGSLERRKPINEIREDIGKHMKWLPFYVFDSLKALERGDSFNFQSLLEQIREAVFYIAAVRREGHSLGSKRAFRFLSDREKKVITNSYQEFHKDVVRQLLDLYILYLNEIQSEYNIANEVISLRSSLSEIM